MTGTRRKGHDPVHTLRTAAEYGTTTFNADGDVAQWQMTGPGSVNWYYHVNCFY